MLKLDKLFFIRFRKNLIFALIELEQSYCLAFEYYLNYQSNKSNSKSNYHSFLLLMETHRPQHHCRYKLCV